MKLSELVHFRNQLADVSVEQARSQALADVNRITWLVDSQPMQVGNTAADLHGIVSDLMKNYDNLDQRLTQLREQITVMIQQAEKPWFEESYRLYETGMAMDSAQYILDRATQISTDSVTTLRARLVNYSDWRYAGMIIRPGRERFVQDMTSFDPLYVVDESHELLLPCLDQFPEAYQRRLRTYVISDRNTEPIFAKVPQGQFGVVLAYNFFNFRPFEIIRRYLEEIFHVLRPGGTLLMTINDCEREKAVRLAEQHFACYTPGYLVKDLARSIGYEVEFTWNDDPMTWIELRRPGKLTTLRGGQTLAKIVSKPVANSK